MASLIVAPQLFSAISGLQPRDQAHVINFITLFQANPAHPSLSLERLNRARSKNVWSGRVTRNLRAILYKDGDTWALLYADQHDAAYNWAERREVGRHSVTGALQIVEAVETVREVERIIEVERPAPKPPLFEGHGDDYLLSLGIPESWLPTVRRIQDEDQLFVVCDKLPDDISERLVSVAAGELVTPPTPVAPDQPAVAAADTQRRFFFVDQPADLLAALKAPMERWIAFLHPSQRALVTRQFRGPAKVSGSAGTGKTVVAMHRARHLARSGERVLLTSYVSTLCDNIARNLHKLCSDEELEQITTSTVHKQALALVRQVEPRARPAGSDDIQQLLDALRVRHVPDYSRSFIEAEWENVVRLQGISAWRDYRKARRTGRGKGLSVKERKRLWRVFGGTLEGLQGRNMYDWPGLCERASELLAEGSAQSPFSAVIVDEVQDLKPSELRFLKELCADQPGNLMVCGDAGQRIYPGGFSLSALGIEVRGRSSILRVNYRTTEQIRQLADRVLGTYSDDMDGGQETRKGTHSLLSGPRPQLRGLASAAEENAAGVARIEAWLDDGLAPEAIGIFARSARRVESFSRVMDEAHIPWHRLSDRELASKGKVHIGTMHRAKGLEFKGVLVLGCGDRELPSPLALRGVDDPQDQETAIERERRLLYVAMTRARDELTVSWTGQPSRFLAGLQNTEDEQ